MNPRASVLRALVLAGAALSSACMQGAPGEEPTESTSAGARHSPLP